MRAILFICFWLFTASVFAQKKFDKVIKGKLTLEQFSADAQMKQWFLKEHDAYRVSDSLVNELGHYLTGKQIVVVLGTWCSDSQREFPRLIKILEAAHFPMKDLEIYGVTRNKALPVKIVNSYKIKNVPAIMVFDHGTEVRRIVEEAKVSLEYDLLH